MTCNNHFLASAVWSQWFHFLLGRETFCLDLIAHKAVVGNRARLGLGCYLCCLWQMRMGQKQNTQEKINKLDGMTSYTCSFSWQMPGMASVFIVCWVGHPAVIWVKFWVKDRGKKELLPARDLSLRRRLYSASLCSSQLELVAAEENLLVEDFLHKRLVRKHMKKHARIESSYSVSFR